MFKTWAANFKNRERLDATFDGAVLKFIRIKKGFELREASRLSGLSIAYLLKLETGIKVVTFEMRNRIMVAYGCSPSSFKNLATDPVRSKPVPPAYKLEILLNRLSDQKIEMVFNYVENLMVSDATS